MSSPSSLRPAWHRGSSSGGRGFQPPPQVTNERRSNSVGTTDKVKQSNSNKFAALDDEDDPAILERKAEESAHRLGNSRSEGLRSSSNHTRNRPRSLAELASRSSDRERSGSYGSAGDRSSGSGPGNPSGRYPNTVTTSAPPEANVIRYTREKLLSMRPPPQPTPPEELRTALEGTVILAEEPQDPVCWDNFDAEAIWATVVRERRASKTEVEGNGPRRPSRRDNGRWQRGVQLPPPEEAKKAREKEAEKPSDLWDDPVTAGAASDFSAFGAMPNDEPFDFEKMAEATRRFQEELHAEERSRANSESEVDDAAPSPSVKVDPKRPLATIGTTIQTGTPEEVNVFEDFDAPGSVSAPDEEHVADDIIPGIKAGSEDKSATSKLMELIGVTRDEPPEVEDTKLDPVAPDPVVPSPIDSWDTVPSRDAASVLLNPWAGVGVLIPDHSTGFDLAASFRESEREQQQKAEAERRRMEEERRRLIEQQQAEERARQAAMRDQQAGVQTQIELVLMERISTILENSWGQSDLVTILSTLHAEDSRVIPLLNNTDALRALILRNPRRLAIRQNPVFGTEMVVLVVTNTQWQQEVSKQQQQQQQQQALSRSQHQEELQRRERQLQMQSVVPGAPWYYSDPQNNIQGPFRGDEMRQWLEAGYFKSDLPISQKQLGPFLPLSAWFPDLSIAFVSDNGASAEAKERARIEAEKAEAARLAAEREAKEAAERERQKKEAEELARQKAVEEAERQAREEAEAAAAAAEAAASEEEKKKKAGANESSAQLKMMLGLGLGKATPEPPPAPQKPTEKRAPRSALNGQQRSSSMTAMEGPTVAQTKAAASVWGGAAKPATRKSMSEIQQEESRAAAIAASAREGSRPSSSGWANIAASRGGSSAWSGAGAVPKPTPIIQRHVSAPTPHTRVPQSHAAKVAAANAQLSASQSRPKPNPTPVEEFGAKLSPSLEKWCKDQMQKINGTDDLTLVSFCMTLNDPDEIREYLTTYLGNSTQVNNFATDFINHKNGSTVQNEWETTGTKQKTRKKKR